jgi:hypothetical protein
MSATEQFFRLWLDKKPLVVPTQTKDLREAFDAGWAARINVEDQIRAFQTEPFGIPTDG